LKHWALCPSRLYGYEKAKNWNNSDTPADTIFSRKWLDMTKMGLENSV
jgi:hypothetical protein